MVKRDPSAGPESLLIGTDLRAPVTSIDPAFINKGRVKYLRRQELQGLALEASQDISKIDKQISRDFITESSVREKDGCIIMQTDLMKRTMNKSKEASQTDSIESFVADPHLSSVNLCTTST